MARKKDIEEKDAARMDDESGEVRVYEIGFHLDPELSETDVKRAYESIRSAAESAGAIVAEGAPEKVQLAYTISRTSTEGRRDFDSAHFSWIAYEAGAEGHEAVLEAAKAEKRIIRFLDIRTTKDAAKHAAEMREMREKAPQPTEGENVSDQELNAALEEATA